MKIKISISLIVVSLFAVVSLVFARPGGGQGPAGHFNRIDTDSDGTVTKKEWMKHHSDLFDSMDSDNDGKLTEKEMMQSGPGSGQRGGRRGGF